MKLRAPQYDITPTPKPAKPPKKKAVWAPKPMARYHKRPKALINSGKSGAASELLVCANLILLGYDVFRAVAPSCPCDLIAGKAGKLLRVEVRTGYRSGTGKLGFFRNETNDRHDVYAVVLRSQSEIIYMPALDEFG